MIRPQGRCLPGDPHHACWACNITPVLGARIYTERIRLYEMLVELAEGMQSFNTTTLWYQTWKTYGGPFPTLFGLSSHVVHDLWFHRLTYPVKVRTNGNVDVWAWNHVDPTDALDYWHKTKARPRR